MRQLTPLQESMEFAVEQRRRQRLVDTLQHIRRQRAADRVSLPVARDIGQPSLFDLPAGVCLAPGNLQVVFKEPEELLAKLYQLAQSAAQDFEEFCRIAACRGAAAG